MNNTETGNKDLSVLNKQSTENVSQIDENSQNIKIKNNKPLKLFHIILIIVVIAIIVTAAIILIIVLTRNNKNKNEENKNDENENEEDNENEEEKEEDINDLGPFEKIPFDEIKFEDFKCIYIHFKDYINDGEFSSQFKLHQIYNFLKKLKKKCKIKIFINLGEDFGKNQKYIIKLLRISDIHLFRDKNILFEMMKKKYEDEGKKREIEKEKMKILFKTQKILKTLKTHKLNKNTRRKQNDGTSNCRRMEYQCSR
jgi:hypothetical protein